MANDIQAKGAALTQILRTDIPGNRVREGDVIEATFIKRASREAYFDIGKVGTGIVYGLEAMNARELLRNLTPGDKLPAKIIDLDGRDGYAELSLAEAGKQKLWQQVQDLMDSGEIVKIKIAAANAGGLTGNLFDLKAFLPTSQLSNDHQPKSTEGDRQRTIDELKKFIGEELSVKVINVNARSNKLIISERETLNTNIKELLQKYEIGQTVDGLVSGLADFGIFIRFVDEPDIEGLVHISEIDHRIIDNPKELMKLNEAVKVKIIDIRDGRVFLSLKALKPNPWDSVGDKYQAGQEVMGKAYKFNPFGATIDLDGGIQGMIHISEFGGADEMRKMLVIGQMYPFVIEAVRPEEKRLILKLKK
ncbi:MAG TPA: S1 RNA-binding domain-containing protein [Candidatus Paceibacterota bacterium]|nr:S1 RNA-binding domain-containing protein [Candidatus Paceibacterota bacterium]